LEVKGGQTNKMNKMSKASDITLVNPILRNCFPIGLGQMAAYLRDQGLSVEVVDASPQNLSPVDVIDRVLATRPRMVGLTGLWVHYPFIKQVSLGIAEYNRNIIQIAGGYWCAGIPEIVLKETCVSVVVHGEGEKTALELIRALKNKKELDTIDGLSFLRDDKIIKTTNRPLVRDLNKLPWPDYTKFDMNYYIRKIKRQNFIDSTDFGKNIIHRRTGNKRIINEATLFTSRGCFGKCAFCSAPAFGINFRSYNPDYVIDHIRFLKDRYHADIFEVTESLTLISKRQVHQLCEAIINAKLDALFVCVARGDLDLDFDTAQLMQEAGFYKVRIGYESANEYILNTIMDKHIPIEKYYQNTAILQRAGIRVEGTFILNMPGETKESIIDSYRFVKKSKLDYGYVFYANPLPGTRLFYYAEHHGFIKDRTKIITDNPGKDKGRSDFKTYYQHFNFNNLSHDLLVGYKDMIEGTIAGNRHMKTKRYFRILLFYIFINRLKTPLNFLKLKYYFPKLYGYLTQTDPDLGWEAVAGAILNKLGIYDFTRNCLKRLSNS